MGRSPSWLPRTTCSTRESRRLIRESIWLVQALVLRRTTLRLLRVPRCRVLYLCRDPSPSRLTLVRIPVCRSLYLVRVRVRIRCVTRLVRRISFTLLRTRVVRRLVVRTKLLVQCLVLVTRSLCRRKTRMVR